MLSYQNGLCLADSTCWHEFRQVHALFKRVNTIIVFVMSSQICYQILQNDKNHNQIAQWNSHTHWQKKNGNTEKSIAYHYMRVLFYSSSLKVNSLLWYGYCYKLHILWFLHACAHVNHDGPNGSLFHFSDSSQFWILNSEFWILNSEFWILNFE